jgi:hypothetical protein
MKYKEGEIILNKIQEGFKVRWVICGTTKAFNQKEECEKLNIEITNGKNKIDYTFYNSIMESQISDLLTLYKMPSDFVRFREHLRMSICKMWAGYDEDLNEKKISTYREFDKKRIWWLIYEVLNDLSGSFNFSEESPTFEDFCDCFGYDKDSRTAERIYKKLLEQEQKAKSLNISEEGLKYFLEEVHQETEGFSNYLKNQINEQY